MAQFKTAIFIGRNHPDNGLEVYRRVAKKNKIKLTEYIGVPNAAKYLKNFDVAFVSRYLAILEALEAGIPVLAHYNNEIKKDYLQMAPFAKYIQTFSSADDVNFEFKYLKEGQRWAKDQTWKKLADQYESLWQK